MSTIALPTVFRLGLLPLFDRFGLYACTVSLSVPTNNGFYTSTTSLKCRHELEESDITLGSDWVLANGAVFCDGGGGLLDPPQSVLASLPEGHHWTPNEGETTLLSLCHSSVICRRWAPFQESLSMLTLFYLNSMNTCPTIQL